MLNQNLFILLLFTGFCSTAQILNQNIDIPAGQYSATELSVILQNHQISLNYSALSLNKAKVRLESKQYQVEALLPYIFNLEKFYYIVKEGKILIIPLEDNEITISGYVEDAESKERLIGAHIYIPELGAGTTTNTYGFYSLTVNPQTDSLKIYVTSMGYLDMQYLLSSAKNHRLDIFMQVENRQLSEVTVVAEEMRIHKTQMSEIQLTQKDLKAMPAFFGENDILKTIQMLPGVQSGSEGNINFIVRGGGPDQNLVLLDGVPVYNATHLFGFFSVFNVDAIKSVSLTKGGFPARYGGRLSSVLEINMKEGDMREFHGAGSIGILASKLTLEGPIIKDKASFMISGRRTYFDLFYRIISGNKDGYFFDDINAKINYKFSRKDRLYLSFYTGRDELSYHLERNNSKSSSYLGFGNRTTALRWNHLYNDKLFSNLTATYTRYRLGIGMNTSTPDKYTAQEYFSRVQDYGLQYNFDYSFSPSHYLKMGASYTHHSFQPGAFQFQEENYNLKLDSLLEVSPLTTSNDAFLFIEDDWKINTRWRMNAGLHYSAYLVDKNFYHSIQPRLSARYLLNSKWSLKASYAYMQQYIHLLTNSGAGLPTDLWVSSTGKIPPQQSHQWVLGTTTDLWDGKFEFTTELYYKFMQNLIAFKEGSIFTSSANWQDQVAINGKGNAYGWEFLLRKTKGKTTGWIAYTLARTTRQFDDLNRGESYPYKYDRRHDLKVVLQHHFSKKFNMGFAFIFNSGIRATIPTATFIDFNRHQQILYSERNAYEYPPYHRLDVSFNWVKEKRWGERMWSIGLYNAYNNANPFFIFFNMGQRSANKVSLFPILPSISYSFKF